MIHELLLRTLLCLGLLTVALLASCDSDPPADLEEKQEVKAAEKLSITKGEHGTKVEVNSFSIVAPGPDEVVTGDSVMVSVAIEGAELRAPTEGENMKGIAYSTDGQHVHVFIDEKPYMAMYDSEGFSVGQLSEGPHTLRAFPSRSWHESIKDPGAFVAHTFYVKSKSGDPVLKADQPLLTYSRPKGTYVAEDAVKILLDFYLANVELGPDGYKVIASIDGNVVDTLTEWVPYFIEGLTDGDHTIGLKLVDAQGNLVENGPFNDVTQTITIQLDEEAAEKQAAKKSKKKGKKKKEEASTETPEEEKDLIDAMRHSQGL